MTPVEVAEAYYNSISELDHTMMEACVTGKAGKNDVEMVIHFFVITRMRQAYETAGDPYITAQRWIDSGSPATDMTVFGVTDLRIRNLSVNSDGANAVLDADYLLWMPGSQFSDDVEDQMLPGSLVYTDRLSLVFLKGAWRISGIERNAQVSAPSSQRPIR
jgi:hypothetical protein